MEKGFVIIWLCLFVSSSCFLLQSATPPTSTTHNYEHLLLDVLLDEKNLRSALEQRIKKLEDVSMVMHTALEQQNNKTEAALEALKQAYNRENQLQQDFARLQMDFHNLSLNNIELVKRNNKLDAQVHNLSARLDNNIAVQIRNLSVNHNAQTKRDNDMKMQIHNLSLYHDALIKRDNDLEGQIHNLTKELTQDQQRLASVDSRLLSVMTNNSIYHAEFLELKQKQGQQSGFTAQSPADGPSASTITFTNIISNIGNQFNSTTGRFTCVYPGLYFFTLSMFQTYSSQNTHCDIRQNGARMTFVDSNTPTSDGYYQASNSVILHLNKGDMISLEGCSNASTMAYASSFSGFLINTD